MYSKKSEPKKGAFGSKTLKIQFSYHKKPNNQWFHWYIIFYKKWLFTSKKKQL